MAGALAAVARRLRLSRRSLGRKEPVPPEQRPKGRNVDREEPVPPELRGVADQEEPPPPEQCVAEADTSQPERPTGGHPDDGPEGDRAAAARPPSGDSEGPPRVAFVKRAPANEKEAAALNEFMSSLSSKDEIATQQALVEGESLEGRLCRFLAVADMKVQAALALLRADLRWRREQCPANLGKLTPEEACGCSWDTLNNNMPTWFQGIDPQGRPVIFSHYGKFRFGPVLKETTVEGLLQLQIHNSERAARLCGLQSIRLGREISSIVTVVDAEGWDAANLLRRQTFTWARGMSWLDNEHYPERMSKMILINAPPAVYRFWQLFQHFLPERDRNKIQIYADRETWGPKLLELLGPDQLPPEYGGCGVHRGDAGIPLSLDGMPPPGDAEAEATRHGLARPIAKE